MGHYTDRFDWVVSGALRVAYYRALHVVSLPIRPEEFVAYALEQSKEGRFGGAIEEKRIGAFVQFWQWNGIQLGKDVQMNIWAFGFNRGAQTVLLRERFWKGNFNMRTLRLMADPLGLVFEEEKIP